jgi:hypothetical protein
MKTQLDRIEQKLDRLLAMMGEGSEPRQGTGSISQCVPPTLYGDELLAFMEVREKEIRAKKRR